MSIITDLRSIKVNFEGQQGRPWLITGRNGKPPGLTNALARTRANAHALKAKPGAVIGNLGGFGVNVVSDHCESDKLPRMANAPKPLTFDDLVSKGYQVEFHSHAKAILTQDFPDALNDLAAALANLTIPIEEIIAGGGGEAKGTQRLRKDLSARGWPKFEFIVRKTINGKERESISHEIDHVREFSAGVIALEIEWNNKDPFFDRDLENFKRLHADGAISAGVIITRGKSLHENMRDLVRRFVDERNIHSYDDIGNWGYEPTSRQRKAIDSRVSRKRNPLTFEDAFVAKFVADKFGEATTHWRKLEDRVHRGVGNPCPLVLIGLPDTIITFHEGKAALDELLKDEAKEESADDGDEE